MRRSRQSRSYLSYTALGGRDVGVSEVAAELNNWPVDGVLGWLAHTSIAIQQYDGEYVFMEFQAQYVNWALADTFPESIPFAARMVTPGAIPRLGRLSSRVLIHPQALAYLADLALRHSPEGGVTAELGPRLRGRMCRMMLIVNDLLSESRLPSPPTLLERLSVARRYLRYCQFGNRTEVRAQLARLAREHLLLTDYMDRSFDVEARYRKAFRGVGLTEYFRTLIVLITHVLREMRAGEHWIVASVALDAVSDESRPVLQEVLNRWCTSPSRYRATVGTGRDRPSTGGGLDFTELRSRPLIEGRPGELVIPCVDFLCDKVVDEPYRVLSALFGEPSRGGFWAKRTKAIEDYVLSLFRQIVDIDDGARLFPNPKSKGIELADAIIVSGNSAVCIEIKGGTTPSTFLRGSDAEGDRLLGPKDKVLNAVEGGHRPQGRRPDRGILTQGMWQQTKHGPQIVEWLRRQGCSIDKLFPVTVHNAKARMDEVAIRGYIEPLITAASLYEGAPWVLPPTWMRIADLESIAGARSKRIPFVELVKRKHEHAPYGRTDVFLGANWHVTDELLERVDDLLAGTMAFYWATNADDDKMSTAPI